MPLNICLRADDAEKHEFDITTLLFLDDKLYSAGDDGKIKVKSKESNQKSFYNGVA